MFLQSELKEAVARLEVANKMFKQEADLFSAVCKNRYSLCDDLRSELYPALDCLMNMVTVAAGKQATADVGDRYVSICQKLREKQIDLVNQINIMTRLENKIIAEHKEYTADQVGMTVAMVTGIGGVAYGLATGVSVGSVLGGYAIGVGTTAIGSAMYAIGISNPVTLPLVGSVYLVSKLFQRSKNKEKITECNIARRRIVTALEEIAPLRHKIGAEYNQMAQEYWRAKKSIDKLIKMVPRYGLIDEVFKEIYLVIELITALTGYVNKRTD